MKNTKKICLFCGYDEFTEYENLVECNGCHSTVNKILFNQLYMNKGEEKMQQDLIYFVVSDKVLESFIRKINQAITDGYELYGNSYIHNGEYHQAMIKNRKSNNII